MSPDPWQEATSAEESVQIAAFWHLTQVECPRCGALVPIPEDADHLVRRNVVNTLWLVLCTSEAPRVPRVHLVG
jgi:hypothetical protein